MCPGISSDLFLLPSSQLNLQLFYYPQEDHFSFLVYRKGERENGLSNRQLRIRKCQGLDTTLGFRVAGPNHLQK